MMRRVGESHRPLADRIRPKTFAEFVGQDHLLAEGKPLREAIERDRIFSMILWGPPGSGKTTLARVIAEKTKAHFITLSAVAGGVADVKKSVVEAKERVKAYGQRTILFIDEIHRFNKAQQDVLLPHVEAGTVVLIGATTENPSFEVIGPLLSRCRTFVLHRLDEEGLHRIVDRGLAALPNLELEDEARGFLIQVSGGDARIVLNALEIAADLVGKGKRGQAKGKITRLLLADIFQKKTLLYDRDGEEHFNTISAFIKSMRASNADAALYYLARMIEAGEDPLFIVRRMVIFASEDIGMAQPTALVVANGVFRACETIGYPECAVNLAHGAVYLAKAKKDRSVYDALRAAQEDVRRHGNLPIPLKLRNAPTKFTKELGYGQGYEPYPDEDLLPEKLKGRRYYRKR